MKCISVSRGMSFVQRYAIWLVSCQTFAKIPVQCQTFAKIPVYSDEIRLNSDKIRLHSDPDLNVLTIFRQFGLGYGSAGCLPGPP